ncbi:MAG: hypothetical protein EOO69_04270 [Moraxellaceae bacterium]|nr:MAG: hypothetical protein EOO69_04270 [Moraxellaceae bacterium]
MSIELVIRIYNFLLILPTLHFHFEKLIWPFLKCIGLFLSAYVVLQRFHAQLQMKNLKTISDEVIKINDFCLEFSIRYEYFLGKEEVIDKKDRTELNVLKKKIDNHITYLNNQIESFPYGNPLNYFYFMITEKYLFNKKSLEVDLLKMQYVDAVYKDTILSPEFTLFTEDGLLFIDSSYQTILKDEIDAIILSGLDILAALEKHSSKFF